ncbi:hypothetical protein [Ammoniphilus sp. CFH 90114]|uniref:hypothetical protein n=1 Tax=Ammoniphilus sp. CFH 90114 TaxID=2493665 RepID=UPI00100DF8B7|nr:hypothetical protein [Ammoniphilus sp. CFH 90114]RXT14663.1 hypothetical protein EIZ39_00140 [Ammoniphilus sp. CFH 90114]
MKNLSLEGQVRRILESMNELAREEILIGKTVQVLSSVILLPVLKVHSQITGCYYGGGGSGGITPLALLAFFRDQKLQFISLDSSVPSLEALIERVPSLQEEIDRICSSQTSDT